ncbi:MAG: AMMECR1 domain-containing protein, partial [Planctomycetota bacterium]
EEPLSLRLGIDGIYIKKGCASGCFLPQVADETGWSKEEFLSYCCAHKAGLPADAWKDAGTEVYFFTADVFGSEVKEI